MQHTKLITIVFAALVFLTALLSGPPSFDATDGAEFAVCGANLQIAHAPGYPLFLLMIRIFSILFSPVYGHLRLLNCFLAALSAVIGIQTFKKNNISYFPAMGGLSLFLFSAPIMSQFNSLEVYPLAIILVLSAMALQNTKLSSYASAMAIFAGHPVALLLSPLYFRLKQKWYLYLIMLIPLTLYFYIPLRAGGCRIAHYGHPTTITNLIGYFTMYSGRLSIPSIQRLLTALKFISLPTGISLLTLSAFGGKLSIKKDIPILLSCLFLASYELPDPAGQLWILLLPLSLRAASGIQNIYSQFKNKQNLFKLIILLMILVSAVAGTIAADRTKDNIALTWTLDIMNSIPLNSVYRTVAHDTFYAAYAVYTLNIRPDIILSDPYGCFFEFSPPAPISTSIGNRTVYISRAWDRTESFSLQGLLFAPKTISVDSVNWDKFGIFMYEWSSPDPMAMDIVSEAWMRRMIQEEDETLRNYYYEIAIQNAATPTTRERIKDAHQNL